MKEGKEQWTIDMNDEICGSPRFPRVVKVNQNTTTSKSCKEAGQDTPTPVSQLQTSVPVSGTGHSTHKNPGTVVWNPHSHTINNTYVNSGQCNGNHDRADPVVPVGDGPMLSPGEDPGTGGVGTPPLKNPGKFIVPITAGTQAMDGIDPGIDATQCRPPSPAIINPQNGVTSDQVYPSFDEKAIKEHAERIRTFWPETTDHARALFPAFCELYTAIKACNRPNAIGARITLNSSLNLREWETRLAQYHDKEICAYLRYGWPVGYSANKPPTSVNHNHPSGDNFKSYVNDFITTECDFGAMLGPFSQDPFAPWFRISPIMSRPKKDPTSRRIIIDLTFPEGAGVNSGIDIHSIFGKDISYKLPSIWDLIAHLQTIGRGAWIWVADLRRAYRQLRVDPLDTPLLGLRVDRGIFLDLCPAFGCRSSSAACQRTSNAVAFLMRRQGHIVYAYLDDYAGCSKTQHQALEAYAYFKDLTQTLGLELAPDKCYPPATSITWLGYSIDTIKMEVSVPSEKLNEVLDLCNTWLSRARANKRMLQSFVGKILHVAPCIRHSRKFTARMLATLRAMELKNWTTVSSDFKADVLWFRQYAVEANGVSLFSPDIQYLVTIECDACLTGAGGNTEKLYYEWVFSKDFMAKYETIHQIEAINIVVAFRTLCPNISLQGNGVLIFTDNLSSAYALSTGVTKDPILAACARELWLEGAIRDVEIKITHKPGSLIPLADALSRASVDQSKRSYADCEIKKRALTRLPPTLHHYQFFDPNI